MHAEVQGVSGCDVLECVEPTPPLPSVSGSVDLRASVVNLGPAAASREAIIDVLLKVGGENGLLLQHGEHIKEADINPLIVSDAAAVAVDARFILT